MAQSLICSILSRHGAHATAKRTEGLCFVFFDRIFEIFRFSGLKGLKMPILGHFSIARDGPIVGPPTVAGANSAGHRGPAYNPQRLQKI